MHCSSFIDLKQATYLTWKDMVKIEKNNLSHCYSSTFLINLPFTFTFFSLNDLMKSLLISGWVA